MILPRVSIIIPVYNAEKYLIRCIDSIQAQTLPDFEALFIDDCSTDASVGIIEEHAKLDPRIKLIRLEKNCGSGIARNAGIENACGEYLSFIDVDDTVAPNFIELLAKKAKETGADIVKGSCVNVSNEDVELSTLKASNSANALKERFESGYKLYNLFIKEHWSAIYKRSFIEAHLLRYGLARASQDSVFLLKVGFFAKTFETAENATYYYFENEVSVVHSFTHKRFFNSLISFGEMIDFINENDPYSEELTIFLASILQRRMPEHTFLSMQSESADTAPGFLKKLYDILIRYRNLDALIERDYAVRVLIESEGTENISPFGIIVGMKENTQWRLFAFGRLVDHLNSDRADKTAGMEYLYRSLSKVEGYLKLDNITDNDVKKQRFYSELQSILSKLNDKNAFIQKYGIAARSMMEYGVNLFEQKTNNVIRDTQIMLDLIRRTVDIIGTHREASNEYREYYGVLSSNLLRRIPHINEHAPEAAQKLSAELIKQIKRINALTSN